MDNTTQFNYTLVYTVVLRRDGKFLPLIGISKEGVLREAGARSLCCRYLQMNLGPSSMLKLCNFVYFTNYPGFWLLINGRCLLPLILEHYLVDIDMRSTKLTASLSRQMPIKV